MSACRRSHYAYHPIRFDTVGLAFHDSVGPTLIALQLCLKKRQTGKGMEFLKMWSILIDAVVDEVKGYHSFWLFGKHLTLYASSCMHKPYS